MAPERGTHHVLGVPAHALHQLQLLIGERGPDAAPLRVRGVGQPLVQAANEETKGWRRGGGEEKRGETR